MIRAKVHCDSVNDQNFGPKGEKTAETVYLNAVYGKDGTANASWSKATPAGAVTLTISNPEAWGKFKQGKFYFLDFTETTEDA